MRPNGFKSVRGWKVTNLEMTQGLGYLCAEANEPVIIPDTLADPRTQGHPLVTGDPYFRFFAAVPLYEGLGSVVGTLSIFDSKPRELESIDRQSIFDLGGMAQSEILSDQIDGCAAGTHRKARCGATRSTDGSADSRMEQTRRKSCAKDCFLQS